MSNKITAWSFSRWSCYEECPRKAKYKFIDKLPEPGSVAMDRGADIHKKLERYLSQGGRFPKEATPLKDEYRKLRKAEPMVEMQVAFTSRWEPSDWFGRDTWCRVVIDALVPPVVNAKTPVVDIRDHKTGKVREGAGYEVQLELYGLTGLLMFPVAERATASLMFVDHGVIVPVKDEFKRSDVPALKKTWEKRVKPMMNDTRFQVRPGNYCRWCHFRRQNGGPCEY